jgi:putative ABC transport system permease protein
VAAPVRAGGIVTRGIDPEVIKLLAQVEGVSHYSAMRRVSIETQTGSTNIQAVDLAEDGYEAYDFLLGNPDEFWPTFKKGEGVIISDPYAYLNRLNLGDLILLPTKGGDCNFPILGIYRDYNSDQGTVTLDRSTYIKYWQDDVISSLGIYLNPNVDADNVMEMLSATAAPHQALIMESNKFILEMSLRVFDRTFVITSVLYWLAMIVAFVGVLAAALALSLERGKELAILRALGMTRKQIAKLVIIQCGSMGLLAGLFALPVGIVSGWLLIHVINRRAFGWQIDMILPLDTLATALAIAVLTALVASIYPAWLATKSTPVSTLREE